MVHGQFNRKHTVLSNHDMWFVFVLILYLSCFSITSIGHAQPAVDDNSQVTIRSDSLQLKPKSVPVVMDGDTLLQVYSNLDTFSPSERAAAINRRINQIIANKMSVDSIKILDQENIVNITIGSFPIMSVTAGDAKALGKNQQEIGAEYVQLLREAIEKRQSHKSLRSALIGIALALLFLAAAFFAFRGLMIVFPKLYARIEGWQGTRIRSFWIGKHEFLSASALTSFCLIILKGFRLLLSLVILYLLITSIISSLPWTRDWDIRTLLSDIFYSALLTVTILVIWKVLNNLFGILLKRVEEGRGTLLKDIRLKTMILIPKDSLTDLTKIAIKVFHAAAILLILYLYITIVFSFFTLTQTWAAILFGYVATPVSALIIAVVSYLPNLFFIVVIVTATHYVIKFIKLFFTELGRETISLPNFYPEWAMPTFKIVRFLVIAFAIVVIFPYLPGSDSPFFQGISIFLGILFSLGSTSAIGNMIAGLVITYMRPFKIGDRVKIADAVGDVVEKTLLVTRLRTIKNVDISIPNAMVLSSHIINFSSSAKHPGLILNTTITIGYDAPWRKVHEVLLAAAQATDNLLKEPPPFILQTALNDFYVSYELNVYTEQPNITARIYSDLHQNIQDKFNEAGIEIMSSHYSAVRDGNQTTIPEDYLPKNYEAPKFRILPWQGDDPKKGK